MPRTLAVTLAALTFAGLLSCKGGDPQPLRSPVAPETPAPTPPPVPAPSSAGHAYFERVRTRPEVVASYSLRDQAMLDSFAHGPGIRADYVTYDYAADAYPAKQDAAKVTIPPDRVSLPTQIRIPLNRVQPTLVTWDAWFGKEFLFSYHGIAGYKNFQFTSPNAMIWFEVRSRFIEAPAGAIARVDTRGYFRDGMGPNVTKAAPIEPQAGTFVIRPETWVRYWAFIDIRQTDPGSPEWSTLSLWVADETDGPVQIIDRRQIKLNATLGMFWLEYNTSSNVERQRGPLVGYARNVVVLGNVTDIPSLFERPIP